MQIAKRWEQQNHAICYSVKNELWYSDVSFVITGSVEEAPVWLAVSVFFSLIALVRYSSPSSMHVSRLRRGQDLVIPLATAKGAIFLLPVLILSILASKHLTRVTGSLCANADKRVSVGCTAILFLSEVWSFSTFCSSTMLAVEHEPASILPFTQTSTVAQFWGWGLSTLTWKVKSKSEGFSCFSSWTYFLVDCDFDGESFSLVLFSFTHASEMTLFWTQATCFSRGGAVWSWLFVVYTTELTCAFSLVVVRWLGFVFIFWFPVFLWVNSVNSVLIQCKLLLHILSLVIDVFFVHCVLQ